jgi:uncharacterized repeat protein (TIGR03847 family)
MPRQEFEFDPPERFVAGTVGEPGQRTFYLQARAGGRVTSVALEKQQVSVLAERTDALLDEVIRVTGGATTVPATVPPELEDLAPLDVPVQEDFRAGTLTLAWDEDDERLVIEAFAVDDSGTEPVEGVDPQTDVLRVRLPGAMARAFAARALSVVSAGRPPCPFCGLPLDPAGHICPRQNGYRRH